jgi:hypothetical protein
LLGHESETESSFFDEMEKMIWFRTTMINSLNTSEQGLDRSEVIVGLWDDYQCWKCHQKTRVLDWSWRSGEGQMWTEDDHIGQKLQQTLPLYRKDYTRITNTYYYCNHCASCGTVQGDWFVNEWVARERAEGRLPSEVVKLKMDSGPVLERSANERDLARSFSNESV